MSYTPVVNADTLTLYIGICATGRATASSTTLDHVSFGTVYAPSSVTFEASDVGMPIAIVGGGPVDADMPAPWFVQGALFHTTIAAYVSPTQVTLTDAPDTSIWNTGFATVILFRPCPFTSDVAHAPTQFQWSSSIAPGTADTLQFSILNTLGGVDNPFIDRFGAITRGMPVYLTSSDPDVGDIFGGMITRCTSYSEAGINPQVYCWSAQCSSWQILAKRRVVPPFLPQTFVGVAGDAAFRKVVLDYLSNDGVAVTATSAPDITLACPVGANIGQLLDQIVNLVGDQDTAWYWTVDPWRTFVLTKRTGTAAPWSITDGTDMFAGQTPYQQSIETSNDQLANNVYLVSNQVLLNTLPVTFHGDGSATTFNLPAQVGATPTITLNAASQTVGILGIDTGKQWYWSQGSSVITQGTGSVLAASDALVVTYLSGTPACAYSPNGTSLQQLQAVEGTSANYDYSASINQPILPDDLLALATGYQTEYSEPAQTCQLYTLRPGLSTGQLQSISLPAAGIPSGSYLIATMQMTLTDNVIVWTYTAFGGANIGDSITALTQFINRQQATLAILAPTTPITAPASVGTVPGQNVVGSSNVVTPLSFPNSVTLGNLLVIVAERNSLLGNPPTVTDSQGNTWTQAIWAQTGGGFPNQIAILYTFASATGPEAVHCDSAQFFSMMEFTGIDPSSPVNTTGWAASSTPPTLTLPADNLLVVTGLALSSAVPTVTAPEILQSYHVGSSQPGVAMSSWSQPPAGSFVSTLAETGGGSGQIYVSVAFNPVAGGTPPPQTTPVLGNPQGTVTHSLGALTADDPVFGNGAGDIKVGGKTGNTNNLVSASGSAISGDPLIYDSSGNAVSGNAGQLVPSGGTTNQVLSKNSGTDFDTSWKTPSGSSPLTTKGDLYGYSSTNARIPIGSDGQVLTADSAQTLGIKWATGGGGTIYNGAAYATATQLRNVITIASTPVSGSVQIFANRAAGTAYNYIPGVDFTVSSATVTLINPLLAGDTVIVYWETSNSTPGSITLSGGPANVSLRGTGIQAASASSFVISWPAGTVVGDLAVIFVGQAFSVTTPAGWTQLFNSGSASNFNGMSAQKILTGTDISAGSVTVTCGGTFDGVAGIATFIGPTGGIRETDASQNSSGSSTTTRTTSSSVIATDDLLLWGCNRGNSTNTINVGAQQQTGGTGSAASGTLYFDNPAPAGATTATFSYSSAGVGNFQAIIVIKGA